MSTSAAYGRQICTTASAARSGSWLYDLFCVDVRALAAMRIGMSLVLLADLAGRATSLAAHYTDTGMLPRAVRTMLSVDAGLPYWSSLHMLGGSVWFQAALFIVASVFAVALLLGYQARAATIGCWLLLTSLQARNPLVLQGGDILLRLFWFWSMFLPLGAVWSMDAKRRPWPQNGYRIVSAASAGLLLQLCFMYVFSALLKTDRMWRTEFSAVYYALSVDHFTSPIGYWLLDHPWLLKPLTAGTWLLEWCGPILLFVPVGTARLRTIVVLSFVLLHLGLGASMELGHFPIICMIYWLAFLPGGFWDWVCCTRSLASQPVQVVSNLITNSFAGALLVYVLLLNVYCLKRGPVAPPGGRALSTIASTAGLAQFWNMFAEPYHYGGWLTFRGKLADGSEVDLWPLAQQDSTRKPASVATSYGTQWWRRSLTNLFEIDEPSYRRSTADFLRRTWEQNHPGRQIVAVEMWNNVEPTLAPGSAEQKDLQRELLLHVDYPR